MENTLVLTDNMCDNKSIVIKEEPFYQQSHFVECFNGNLTYKSELSFAPKLEVEHLAEGGSRQFDEQWTMNNDSSWVVKRELDTNCEVSENTENTQNLNFLGQLVTGEDIVVANGEINNEDIKVETELYIEESNILEELAIGGGKREKRTYKCGFCSQTRLGKKSLDRHMVVHSSLHMGKKTSSDAAFKCCFCDDIYESSYLRTKHVAIAHSQKLFRCKICSKFFMKSTSLERHALIHKHIKRETNSNGIANHEIETNELLSATVITRFKCCFCDKICKTALLRKKHIVEVHSQNAFECDKCGAVFMKSSTLAKHALLHKYGRKDYTCNYCKKTYRQEKSIVKHLSLVHPGNENNIIQFKCCFCDEIFYTTPLRNKHITSQHAESAIKCHLCGKIFMKRSTLARHLLMH